MTDLILGILTGFALGIAFSIVIWFFASKSDAKLNQLEAEKLEATRNFAVIPPKYYVENNDDDEVTGQFTRESLYAPSIKQ